MPEDTDHAIAETGEISEDFYVDIDEHGNVVSMTIKQAIQLALSVLERKEPWERALRKLIHK